MGFPGGSDLYRYINIDLYIDRFIQIFIFFCIYLYIRLYKIYVLYLSIYLYIQIYIYAYMVLLQSVSLVQLLQPLFCTWPDSSVHGISRARILEWVSISFSRELPDQKLESRSPALQADSLLTELCGDPHICIDRCTHTHTSKELMGTVGVYTSVSFITGVAPCDHHQNQDRAVSSPQTQS